MKKWLSALLALALACSFAGALAEEEPITIELFYSPWASTPHNGVDPYEEYLEEKTARVLRQVEGVGEVTVMITLKSGGQKIIEKDQSSSGQTTEETDSEGGTRSVEDQSSDKTSIYVQDADGSSAPYVSKELSPEIAGVAVIADGGDDAVTAQNITEAVQALFGVEAHKIKIMKRADT